MNELFTNVEQNKKKYPLYPQQNSKDKMYQKMYENMVANSAVLVSNNDEGEKRVLNGRGKYAFFMESTTIEYKLKRNCDLKKVGGELDSKDYGIAMPASKYEYLSRQKVEKCISSSKKCLTLTTFSWLF